MRDLETRENESLPPDERRVSEILASLRRVEAPANFGFRVKGRISARRQSEIRRRWVPASAAVAAPLGLALAIGGYFVLTTSYSPGIVPEPQTAELRPIDLPAVEPALDEVASAPPVTDPRAEATSTGVSDILKAKLPAQSPATLPVVVKRTDIVKPTSNAREGSTVETQRIANELPAVSLPIQEVLQKMGVDATYSRRSWTVGTVRNGTAAARSGLMPGDVIESINGRALDINTSFEGRFTPGSVRLRRDGKAIQIDLH